MDHWSITNRMVMKVMSKRLMGFRIKRLRDGRDRT